MIPLRTLLKPTTSAKRRIPVSHQLVQGPRWAVKFYSQRIAGEKCPGCGASYQTTLENKAGYIDLQLDQKRLTSRREEKPKVSRKWAEQALFDQAYHGLHETQKQQFAYQPLIPVSLPEKKKDNREVCDRCHDISHHRKATDRSTATQELVFNAIKESHNPLVVHVMDYSDFPTSFIPDLPKLTNVVPERILYVLNRLDRVSTYMPHVMRIMKYFHAVARGLSQYPDEVSSHIFPLSARRPWALTRFFTHVEGNHGDVFFIGHTNVGKSALIGSMPSLGRTPKRPLESLVPATTADILQVPNPQFRGRLFDTPGLGMGLLPYCLPSEYTRLLDRIPSRKRINLNPGRCILFEGIVLLKFVKGTKPLTVFNHTPFQYHPCRSDRAEELMKRGSFDDVKISAFPEAMDAMKLALEVDVSRVPFNRKYRVDIAFAGFGWLELRSDESESIVEIHTPHGEGIASRSPIPT